MHRQKGIPMDRIKLRNAFLNAAYVYPKNNAVEPGSAEACKVVLDHLKVGNIEQAAIEAGKHPTALFCWEAALDAASHQFQPQAKV